MDNNAEIQEPVTDKKTLVEANLKFGVMVALFVGGLYYVIFKT